MCVYEHRNTNAAVFLLVLDTQSLVGGVRLDEHPSMVLALASLVPRATFLQTDTGQICTAISSFAKI